MRSLLAVLLTLVLGSASFAQPPGVAPPARESEVVGTIVNMDGSVIFIREDGTDQIWRCDTARNFIMPDGIQIVTMKDSVVVEMNGSENVAALRPGQGLKFQVKLTERQLPQGEVSEATLFAPNPEIKQGLLESEPVSEETRNGRTVTTELCTIAGTISKPYKNGVMTIAYPSEKGSRQNLAFRMPADAAITVEAKNLSLTRPGDRIKASGPGWVPLHFLARNISIERVPPVDEKTAKKGFVPEPFKPKDTAKERAPAAPNMAAAPKPAPAPAASKAKVRLELLKVN